MESLEISQALWSLYKTTPGMKGQLTRMIFFGAGRGEVNYLGLGFQ